jgi:type II secretory pathway component PulF
MVFNLEHLVEPMLYIATAFIVIYIVMYLFRVRRLYKIMGKLDRYVWWIPFISVTPDTYYEEYKKWK